MAKTAPIHSGNFRSEKLIINRPKKQIAVIGSGIAGLSAAWFLTKRGLAVTLFEAGSKAGLAAHSNDFAAALAIDSPVWGDVPARMFNSSLWPTLTQLYIDADIKFENVDNTQSFFDDENGVFLNAGLPYRIRDIAKNALNPIARQTLDQLSTFRETSLRELESDRIDSLSFRKYLDSFSGDVWDLFFARFLFPTLTSTVFTCPSAALLDYPCRIVLEALRKITESESPLSRTTLGSVDAANHLLRDVDDVKFSTPVIRVCERDDHVVIDSGLDSMMFDDVVIATQANHASELVAEAWPDAANVLREFRYVDVPVVVHTDISVMPPRKSSWSTFNFKTENAIRETSSCSVWMNRFHRHWPKKSADIFHTIFPDSEISDGKVISKACLQRPVVDQNSHHLIDRMDALARQNRRLWFVGSYASQGVPLLESAVQSSHRVAEIISARYKDLGESMARSQPAANS